jgi:flagellar FliJ protein
MTFMGRFQFRFDTLKKIRESERQQRRLELAQALQAEQLVETQIHQLEAEEQETRTRCQAAAGPGRVDVDTLLDIHRYAAILKVRVQLLRDQLARLRTEIERRRQVLVEADRQVRVLEKLRERQWDEYCLAESRREVKNMDEVAQRSVRHGT